MKNNKLGLNAADITLWALSIALTTAAYLIFDGRELIRPVATAIGITSLILTAKGNPLGQLFIIIFGVLYGVISYSQAYYGEMITYLGMTAPMALAALISWLRHPYEGKRMQVRVARIGAKDLLIAIPLTVAVTVAFYFILKALGTADIIVSTLSVSTSFFAVYLTIKRSPFLSLAYAANDVVLIVLWTVAAVKDVSYISVVICFVTFLVNDVYGFICLRRIERAQRS